MQNNYINLFTNIKDVNINISNSYLKDFNNFVAVVSEATLDYLPEFCPKCGVFHPKLLSKGFQKPSLILLNNSANQTSYLSLKKKRYSCLECNSSFTLSTPEVDKHCFISNNVKASVACALTKATSLKDIANDHNISFNTVARVLDTFHETLPKSNMIDYLPPALLFDEFKSVKNINGKMSFIFMDANNHKIIDIVDNRQLHNLLKYFNRYTKNARDNVKTIVIDMYKPYIILIKKMFKNALIVFDKFHIIQHINRALNKARIDLMNKNKNNYNKLKRYWKLLLTNRNNLDNIYYRKSRCFNKMLTDLQIVDYLINIDETFKESYYYYQDFIKAIEYRDKDKMNSLLLNIPNNISIRLVKALQSLVDNKEYILNTLDSEYTNGAIEGTNNKIKLLKRVSYGFRSFINFKLRIMLHFNLIKKHSFITKPCSANSLSNV